MRLFDWRTILVAAIAGAGVMVAAAGAEARDRYDDRWERRRPGVPPEGVVVRTVRT